MNLSEYVKTLIPSDRLILEDETGEIFRGYAATLEYAGVNQDRTVIRHGLKTDIRCHKTNRSGKTQGKEAVTPESVGIYSFSDLEMQIYNRVVLEG